MTSGGKAPMIAPGTTPTPAPIPPTSQLLITSASIAALTPSSIVIVVNSPDGPLLPAAGITGFSVKVNGAAATISSVSRTSSLEVTIQLSTYVVGTDVVSFSYSPGNLTDSASEVFYSYVNQAVTNNSTTDVDVIAYSNAVKANSGTLSTSTFLAVDELVSDLKAHGLWTRLTEYYPFAGNQMAAAVVKLKKASGNTVTLTNHNFIAADYSETGTNGGFRGNGTSKYFDTNLSVLGMNQNDMSIGAYVRLEASSTYPAGSIMGSSYDATGDTDRFYMLGNGSNGALIGQMGLGQHCPGGYANGIGLRTLTYFSSMMDGYQNSTRVLNASKPGLTWQQAGTVHIFRGAGNFFHDGRISSSFVGTGLTTSEMVDLYNDIQTFETALGRNI